MEIISFTTKETGRHSPRVGAVSNNEYLLDFERALNAHPPNHLAWLDMDSSWFQNSHEKYSALARDAKALNQAAEKGRLTKRKDAYWLAPVPRPGKLICIGLNYRDHAAESNTPIPSRPVVFSKFSTAFFAPDTPATLTYARSLHDDLPTDASGIPSPSNSCSVA